MKSVHTLEGSELQLLTASLATSRFREENAWTEIASIVTKKVAEIKVGDLRGIAGSFSVASQTDHEMLAAISSRFKESPESLNCFSWADFIFSLERAQMRDAELVKVAADAMFTKADALKTLKDQFDHGLPWGKPRCWRVPSRDALCAFTNPGPTYGELECLWPFACCTDMGESTVERWSSFAVSVWRSSTESFRVSKEQDFLHNSRPQLVGLPRQESSQRFGFGLDLHVSWRTSSC